MQNLLMEQFGLSPAEMVPLEGGKTNRLWRSGDQVVKLLNAAGAALRLNPNEDRFPHDIASDYFVCRLQSRPLTKPLSLGSL